MTNPLPRPEYPRPQFVRKEWLNLNGEWEFEIDNGCSGEEQEFQNRPSLSRKITVPFCPESELSGIGHKDFMDCVWYRREITVPDEWNGKRIILHFGAVDYETTVWVNGEKAGTHMGGYSPFSFDITELLTDGTNAITVKAVDDTRSPLQASGKQSMQFASHGCCYTRTTGIWQTVWLEPVSETHISSVRYYPDAETGSITLQVNVKGNTEGVTVKADISADSKITGAADLPVQSSTTFTVELSDKKLWSIEDPFLYDITLSLENDENVIDSAESYFGLRTIEIRDKKVLINGKSVFQRLVLDQGFYPDGICTAPSDEAMKKDIELSIAAGFNGARLHMKVFEPGFLYWADRLGYLVWGEYPNWGLDHEDSRVLERVIPEWIEVVERDFNHPSIVGWCPFNETGGRRGVCKALQLAVYRATKSIDPTRPVIDTSGYVHCKETDIYDCHNYEQNPEKLAAFFEEMKTDDKVWNNIADAEPYKGQPYFVSEYGGIGWDIRTTDEEGWGYGENPKTEAEFIERYKGLTEALLFHPKMFAFCYTQLYDVEQEINGLYTYERKPKFDMEIFRKINSQKAAIED